MLDVTSNFQLIPASRYHVSLAVDDSEIREAQRLRHEVFAEEMGARLSSTLPGHDTDLYDPFCDHLLVRELGSGEVVGTYRILPPDAGKCVGSYSSEQECACHRKVCSCKVYTGGKTAEGRLDL